MKEQEKYRHVPYDIEVEQAILGSILSRNDYLGQLDELRPDHFYDPLHQRLFETFKRKFDREVAITPLTINAAMKSDPGFQEVGSHAYLVGLVQAAPALPNVREFARITRELATRRRLIHIGEDLVNDAYDEPDLAPSDKIADAAGQALYEAIRNTEEGFSEPKLLSDFGWDAVKLTEQAISSPDEAFLTTGLKTVDDNVGVLFPGDEIVIAGATSMGKTALAQDIFIANGKRGKVGLFFSLEMPGTQLATRNIAQLVKVSADKIRRGSLSTQQFEAVALAPGTLAELPLYIDDSPELSVAQIAARCQAIRRKAGQLDLVVVDHLQFVEPANPRQEERDQLRQITRDLKRLAKRMNVVLILLSHITKENERRASKRPVLADLYGSVGIQQNADAVIFVHREEYYLEREKPEKARGQKAFDDWLRACEENKGQAEIFAAKARMGKLGSARVKFDGKHTQFSDLEEALTDQQQLDMAGLIEQDIFFANDPARQK